MSLVIIVVALVIIASVFTLARMYNIEQQQIEKEKAAELAPLDSCM